MIVRDWYFVIRDKGLPYAAVYDHDNLLFCIPLTYEQVRAIKTMSNRQSVHEFLFNKAKAVWEASK